MKQFSIHLALLCTLLLAAGCSKDTETETTRPADAASLIKIGDFPAFDQGADTRATGTPDPGKAQWVDGDKVLLKLSKTDFYGSTFFCYTLTYDGANAQWNSDTSMDRVIDNNELAHMNVTAHYAPAYEWNASNEPALKSGKQPGTDEYLTYIATDVHLRDGITIDFSGTRPYSRLRVATEAGFTVAFTPSNATFTPSGSSSALSDATTLSAKADAKGNAFFYGTWTAGSEFTFIAAAPSKMGEVKKTIADAAAAGESYAVDATQLIDVASMSMSIDTRKNTSNPSDATFILPINGTIRGYRLFVDWGDGKISAFNDGTALDQNKMTHTYPQAGEFTITISSTQTDATQQQMPYFNFATYSQNANTSKFTSLNSPLLNMGVTSFTDVFKNCTNLTTIPSGLFDNNTQVTRFGSCFQGCTGLTEIPSGLFDKNTGVTTFEYCFQGCTGLTAIPSRLFDNNTGVKTFQSCFLGCTGLTAIPSGLFDKNTGVTTFEYCFNSCTELTAIPSGLFGNNTEVTTFENCFLLCAGLTAIPAGLFDNNTEVTTFEYCFNSCTGLTAIPSKLFDNNTGVTTFVGCFNRCTGLTAIPSGLFDNNTGVTTFEYCFNSCAELTAIPEMLFAKNRAATNFNSCFDSCKKVVLNPNIFCNETADKDTRFNGQTVDFTTCFFNCGSDRSVTAGNGGTAPALWSYQNMAGVTSKQCFRYANKVTNVKDIPAAWKQ